jgi:mRNA-degrading endonuclease toxin of MazEF toxin-antitoxin module
MHVFALYPLWTLFPSTADPSLAVASDGQGDELLPILAIAVILLAGLVTGVLRRSSKDRQRSRRRTPPHRHRMAAPAPFTYWYALVPFEDSEEAKDRPVLVLRREADHARVLKVTSQEKVGRTNYRRIDTSRWDRPGARNGSWVQTDNVVTVPVDHFRRRLGVETDQGFKQELMRIHRGEFT